MNAIDLAYALCEAFEAAGYPYLSPQVLLDAVDHTVTDLLVEVWDDAAQCLVLIAVEY